MSFFYTKEQKMIKDAVHDFAEKEVKPAASEIDRKDEFLLGKKRTSWVLEVLKHLS